MKTTLASRLLAGIGLASAAFSHAIPAIPAYRGPTRSKRAGKSSRYVRGLQNHFARQQRERMEKSKQHPLRDEHGAYTVVGRDAETSTGRRMWVAGISAQRGY